jgi:hypothetical protein
MRTIIIDIADGALPSAAQESEIHTALENAADTTGGELRLRVRHEQTSLLVQIELVTPGAVLSEELALPDGVDPRQISDRVADVLRYWDAVRYWKTVSGTGPTVTRHQDEWSD